MVANKTYFLVFILLLKYSESIEMKNKQTFLNCTLNKNKDCEHLAFFYEKELTESNDAID